MKKKKDKEYEGIDLNSDEGTGLSITFVSIIFGVGIPIGLFMAESYQTAIWWTGMTILFTEIGSLLWVSDLKSKGYTKITGFGSYCIKSFMLGISAMVLGIASGISAFIKYCGANLDQFLHVISTTLIIICIVLGIILAYYINHMINIKVLSKE